MSKDGGAAGVEHLQYPALIQINKTGKPIAGLDPMLTDPTHKTPNQRAMACALALVQARHDAFDKALAIKQCLDLFDAMLINGHQAVGQQYGDEQAAPMPHNALWAAPFASILNDARSAFGELLDDTIAYWADHIAMCAAFWTPAGMRVPCARALVAAGQPMRPSWALDSRIYSDVTGTPLPKEDCDWDTVAIMRASSALFPNIAKLAKTKRVKLAVPVLKWARAGGGFIAALDHDVPMNSRCSWLIVSADGAILDASNTMTGFVRPAGPPDLVFGGPATVQDAPQNAPGATIAPPPPSDLAPMADPQPAPTPAVPAVPSSGGWLDWIKSLFSGL